MSDATRAVALAEASKLNLKSADEVLAVAARYDAFLNAKEDAPAPKAETPKASSAPKKTAASKAPAKTEDQVVSEALSQSEGEDGSGDEGASEGPSDGLTPDSDGVQAGVAKLLKNNLRKEAVALLKKFGAAKSSDIKAKDAPKFVAEVRKLLPSDDEGSDDLTA